MFSIKLFSIMANVKKKKKGRFPYIKERKGVDKTDIKRNNNLNLPADNKYGLINYLYE